MESIFFDITVIVVVASFLSFVFRVIKQPPILAYIATGILLGPIGIFPLNNVDSLRTLAQLGITLVLFMLGLELRLSDLSSVGPVAIVTGVIQICLTFLFGFYTSLFLGFSTTASIYIAIALAFSSTIVIVKLLSDIKDLTSLYAKLSVGILLLQDFFAVITLIVLSGFSGGIVNLSSFDFISLFLKGFWLLLFMYTISETVLPILIKTAARSTETLFLFSLAWVFSVAAFVSSPLMGFSIEIGGFLAGLSLARYAEHFQISARVRSLRDFFITIFFVLLGFGVSFSNLSSLILPAFFLSFIVIFFKPFIVFETLGFFGYRKRTSFLAGISLGQISEFSLIILFLGQKLGHINGDVISLMTIVAVISFIISTSFILGNKKIYRGFEKQLVFVEKKNKEEDDNDLEEELKDHVVIIGGHQMGQSILEALEDSQDRVVVVDFDPDIVKKLKARGIANLFGDIVDLDIQERARLDSAKMVISTIPDLEDNLALIKRLNHENRRAKIVVMAYEVSDARALYKAGADYVVLPHLAGGRHVAKILKENQFSHIDNFRKKDLEFLK